MKRNRSNQTTNTQHVPGKRILVRSTGVATAFALSMMFAPGMVSTAIAAEVNGDETAAAAQEQVVAAPVEEAAPAVVVEGAPAPVAAPAPEPAPVVAVAESVEPAAAVEPEPVVAETVEPAETASEPVTAEPAAESAEPVAEPVEPAAAAEATAAIAEPEATPEATEPKIAEVAAPAAEAAAEAAPKATAQSVTAPSKAPSAPAKAPADESKTINVGADAECTSIQAAIDYIDSQTDKDGWTINLADGEYTRFKVHSGVTNLTVTGGKGAVISVLDNTPDPTTKAAPDTGGINIQQTQGFTLRGITVSCGGDTSWPHFAITNFGNAGGGDNLTVDDVHFTGTAGSALLMSSGMHSFSVTNCVFDEGINTAINVMNDNTAVGTVTITGNTFNKNDFALHGYWGGENGGTLTFKDNTVIGQGHTDGTKRCKVVIQDQMNTSAVKPVVSGNTLNDALVGLINVNDDGASASAVLGANKTNDGTFAVDGVEPGTIDMYSSYVVNQGDYKYGKWVLTGLEDTDWTDEQKQLVQDAVDEANRKQSPVLNISGLADGTLIHTFTWFKNAIYWTPYKDGSGKLTISKKITGNGLESNDTQDEFTFTITLKGDEVPTGNQVFGGVTFTDGVATITLKGGESKTIEGIPAGTTYTVEEAAFSDDNDELQYTVNGGKGSKASGSIKAKKEVTADFTNSKDVPEPEPEKPEKPEPEKPEPEKPVTPAPTPKPAKPTPVKPAAKVVKHAVPATGDASASGAGFAGAGIAALVAGIVARMKRRYE